MGGHSIPWGSMSEEAIQAKALELCEEGLSHLIPACIPFDDHTTLKAEMMALAESMHQECDCETCQILDLQVQVKQLEMAVEERRQETDDVIQSAKTFAGRAHHWKTMYEALMAKLPLDMIEEILDVEDLPAAAVDALKEITGDESE